MLLFSTVLDTTTFEVKISASDSENSFIFDNDVTMTKPCVLCNLHIVVESHFIYESLVLKMF